MTQVTTRDQLPSAVLKQFWRPTIIPRELSGDECFGDQTVRHEPYHKSLQDGTNDDKNWARALWVDKVGCYTWRCCLRRVLELGRGNGNHDDKQR